MTTPNLKLLDTQPKKQTRTSVDTILITPELVERWKNPPFQRPLKVNAKVAALAEQIKADGGVIPGVLTLGVLHREEFLLDGQHRRQAFVLSECKEGFADVRKHFFDAMAEMGEEFVNLNSALVRLRPDDILRGLEGSIEGLSLIRQRCPFVGYDMIRRGPKSPMLSMSQLLRCWTGSANEVPNSTGESAASIAASLTTEDADLCANFLRLAESAWGRDSEYVLLWRSLNLSVCMWLYRRTVLSAYSQKSVRLTRDQFGKCLMALSASGPYIDWLVGRQLTDRDRSPAYARIKSIFTARLTDEIGRKPAFPQPAWSAHSSGRNPNAGGAATR